MVKEAENIWWRFFAFLILLGLLFLDFVFFLLQPSYFLMKFHVQVSSVNRTLRRIVLDNKLIYDIKPLSTLMNCIKSFCNLLFPVAKYSLYMLRTRYGTSQITTITTKNNCILITFYLIYIAIPFPYRDLIAL